MSEAGALPDIHNEPEKSYANWTRINVMTTVVGVIAFCVLGFSGYQITTNGYEVTGGIILVTCITAACHIAELSRTLLRKKLDKA